jgi:hypothetical protein
MFYEEWIQALIKGKAKEKNSAILELSQWLKHPESQDELDSEHWQALLTGTV